MSPEELAEHEVEIGFLQRRRIEANIIAPIYKAMVAENGADKAAEIIRGAIATDARKSGAEFAARETGGPTIATFIDIQRLWRKGDALVTDTLVQTDDTFSFNVTRCRYAEMYREMGLQDIGALLSCVRDAEFIAGYNPDITFSRSQTLMQGASHCDFKYTTAPTT